MQNTCKSSYLYTICSRCDHFVEFDEDAQVYTHLDDGEKEYDHNAIPHTTLHGNVWQAVRPDLFFKYADGKIGPNSKFHTHRQEFVNKEPKYCPRCGGQKLRTCVTDWNAQSNDPSDRGNYATIDEHQCEDCANSFWM